MSDDKKYDDGYVLHFEQKLRDAAGELLSQVAAGEISAEEAQEQGNTCHASIELIRIAAGMGAWSCPPEGRCDGSNADCEMA